MRLVVTGASGFIGGVFCLRAAELGHEILALDDLSRGLNPTDGLTFRVTFLKHDCRGGIVEAVMPTGWPRHSIDAVVHLAAGTGSLDRPLEELRALNLEMTKRVYSDALELGVKAFLFPTTSLALGVPDSPYVISKEEAFAWLKEADEKIGIALPLRFFNVIGAYKGFTERRRNEVHLIPRLVHCYTTREPFVLNGTDYDTVDGSPSRDFINIVDLVDFLLWLIQRKVEIANFYPRMTPDDAIWAGTGRTTTVRQVIQAFEQWVGPVQVVPSERRPYDVGALECLKRSVRLIEHALGRGLTPAWVGIRDEAQALRA